MEQKQCKHKNINRVYSANGDVETVCKDCHNILNSKVEEDQIKKLLDNQPRANCYLAFSLMTSF